MESRWSQSEAANGKNVRIGSSVLEAMPGAIMIVDESGGIVALNQLAEHAFGYECDVLRGRSYLELFPERVRGEVQQRCRSAGTEGGGSTSTHETIGIRSDGTELPIELTCGRYSTPDGLMRVLGIRDITDRMLVEERFRALLEAAPDAIVIIDSDGVIEFVNRQTERVFGFTREELIEKSVETLVPSRFRDSHLEHRLKFFGEPSIRPMGMGLNLFGLHKNGEEFPVEISLSPLRLKDRLLVIAAVRDITERKASEAAMIRRERLASLGTLTAGIAHEINNPVGAALLTAETAQALLGRAGSEHHLSECLDKIVMSMQRCGNIVRSILRFARADKLERLEVDLNSVVRSACDFVSESARNCGAAVRVELSDDNLYVLASPLEIELAIVNVMQNAIAACQGSGRIYIITEACDAGARIRIEDNGRGMTDDEREHIFDPFYRGPDKPDGTGLGMSIVYGIIIEHEGYVSVDSTPGVGTSVAVELPFARDGQNTHVGQK